MTKFETTDYAQMRRCRMAHLHGERIDEMFEGGVCVSGFIQAIRPDLTRLPLRWSITLKQQTAEHGEMALQE
ncbi:hypothetical protein BH11PSE4_BH11PSE4_11210 [soil metagenome]